MDQAGLGEPAFTAFHVIVRAVGQRVISSNCDLLRLHRHPGQDVPGDVAHIHLVGERIPGGFTVVDLVTGQVALQVGIPPHEHPFRREVLAHVERRDDRGVDDRAGHERREINRRFRRVVVPVVNQFLDFRRSPGAPPVELGGDPRRVTAGQVVESVIGIGVNQVVVIHSGSHEGRDGAG